MKFRPCTWISRWLRLSNLHKSWFTKEFEISDFLTLWAVEIPHLSLIRLTLLSCLKTIQKLLSVLQVRWHPSLDLQPPSELATNPILRSNHNVTEPENCWASQEKALWTEGTTGPRQCVLGGTKEKDIESWNMVNGKQIYIRECSLIRNCSLNVWSNTLHPPIK